MLSLVFNLFFGVFMGKIKPKTQTPPMSSSFMLMI